MVRIHKLSKSFPKAFTCYQLYTIYMQFYMIIKIFTGNITIEMIENIKTYFILCFFFFFWEDSFFFNFILFLNFTILYWFCQIPTWIRHWYTCVSHPEPSSILPPHTIPLGHPSATAPSIQYRTSNVDWRLISYMILYVFQCHSPKLSHPLPLPQSPKDCSIHLYICLFCCLVYRVIVTLFLNSICMC